MTTRENWTILAQYLKQKKLIPVREWIHHYRYFFKYKLNIFLEYLKFIYKKILSCIQCYKDIHFFFLNVKFQ